jgi:hypothetical protein
VIGAAHETRWLQFQLTLPMVILGKKTGAGPVDYHEDRGPENGGEPARAAADSPPLAPPLTGWPPLLLPAAPPSAV